MTDILDELEGISQPQSRPKDILDEIDAPTPTQTQLTPEDIDQATTDIATMGSREVEQVPNVDPHIVEYVAAVPEVAKSLAGSATVGTLGYTGGFIEGLMGELMSGEFGTQEAARRIEQKAMERATGFAGMFAPESEAGMKMMEGLAGLTEDLPPLAPLLVEANILSAAARASAPLLTAKFANRVNLIDSNTGLPSKDLARALNKKDVKYSLILDDPSTLPMISDKSSVDDVVESVMRKRIKQGSGHESLAPYRLDSRQKVVPDDLGVESVRQGFRPGDVASAKNSNLSTKRRMMEMLKIKRRIQGDSSVALEVRPSKIAGDELMKRFDHVKSKALELRNDLNTIAEGGAFEPGTLPGPGIKPGLKGLEIDTSAIESSVLNGLRKINIEIPDDVLVNTVKLKDYLKRKDAFIGSDISKDKTSQKVIRDTIELLSEPGSDAYRAHKIKRQIDTMVDFRKKTSGGLTDSGENFAKSIRKSLNDSIREVNPQYARVNDDLSKSINAMNSLKEAIPRRVDIFGEGAEEALGQELRKLLSNYSSRQDLRNSIKTLDDVSKEFGGDFDVDVNKLVQFNNTLDDRFGATARGSFKGEIESAVSTLRPKEIIKDKASQAVIDAINKYRNINDEAAFDSMQKLLKGD